jgi:glycerate kinase
VRLRIACDVRNPLTGPAGAAAVFGPQKGARPLDIEVLDANLAKLAAVLLRDTGVDIASVPGSGAAGGLTAGLLAIGATTEPGIELILDATRFDDLLADADLVITGEGRLDRQTAQGKVVSGVMAHAARKQVPVVALAGSVRGGEIGSLYAAGLVAAFSITDGPLSHAKAFGRAATLLRRSTEAVVRLWLAAAGQWQQ